MLDPLDSFEVEPPLEVSSSGPPVAPGLGALVDELLGATVAVLSGWSEGGREFGQSVQTHHRGRATTTHFERPEPQRLPRPRNR